MSRKKKVLIGITVFLTVSVLAVWIFWARLVPLVSDLLPRRAPFNAVRWMGERPIVRVDEHWYHMMALDGIPAREIVGHCAEVYGERMRHRRFAQDLYEVLVGMGHWPGDTVRLEVLDARTGRKQVLEDVPMTEENREAVMRFDPQEETRKSGEDVSSGEG